METTCLLGEVAVEVALELRESVGVRDGDDEVVVVRHEHERVDADAEELVGPSEDAQDDLVDVVRMAKQVPTMDGADGDLDDHSGRQIAERARHRTGIDAGCVPALRPTFYLA